MIIIDDGGDECDEEETQLLYNADDHHEKWEHQMIAVIVCNSIRCLW